MADAVSWDGVPGSGEVIEYALSWVEETWLIDGFVKTCNIARNIDGCVDERASGARKLGATTYSYEFTMTENQFTGMTFLDWGDYEDIPVLSAMDIPYIDENGVIRVDSIDTENDGVPGTGATRFPLSKTGPIWSNLM